MVLHLMNGLCSYYLPTYLAITEVAGLGLLEPRPYIGGRVIRLFHQIMTSLNPEASVTCWVRRIPRPHLNR